MTTTRKPKGAPKTPEPPKFELTDPSNHLLATTPSALSIGVMDLETGSHLLFTVRTPSTTMTVALTAKEASSWVVELAKAVQAMQQEAPKAEEPVLEGTVVPKD
jgi:hypothetical protein